MALVAVVAITFGGYGLFQRAQQRFAKARALAERERSLRRVLASPISPEMQTPLREQLDRVSGGEKGNSAT
jgi:hypothetical protein